MAFPTAPLVDTFDGDDVDPLNGTGIWNGGQFFSDDNLQRLSNRVASSTAGFGSAYTNASYSRASTAIELYITLTTLSSNISFFYWCLGGTLASAPDGYVLSVRPGNDAIRISSVVAGVLTTLATSSALGLADGDSYGIRHEPSGLITAYHKPASGSWAEATSATDTTYESGPMAIEIQGAVGDEFGAGFIGVVASGIGFHQVSRIESVTTRLRSTASRLEGVRRL